MRPENDERTVIVEVNKDFEDKKDAIIDFACEEIKIEKNILKTI